MAGVKEYKGYRARAIRQDEDGSWHGEVDLPKDVVTFAADTERELQAGFEESVDDYLDYCEEQGTKPQAPTP